MNLLTWKTDEQEDVFLLSRMNLLLVSLRSLISFSRREDAFFFQMMMGRISMMDQLKLNDYFGDAICELGKHRRWRQCCRVWDESQEKRFRKREGTEGERMREWVTRVSQSVSLLDSSCICVSLDLPAMMMKKKMMIQEETVPSVPLKGVFLMSRVQLEGTQVSSNTTQINVSHSHEVEWVRCKERERVQLETCKSQAEFVCYDLCSKAESEKEEIRAVCDSIGVNARKAKRDAADDDAPSLSLSPCVSCCISFCSRSSLTHTRSLCLR